MINDTETRQLSDEHNLLRAAKKIFKMGPKTLVIKRGEHGAMMVHGDWVFCVPAFPLDEIHDPTGAGDTFAGGFMGYLASAGKINANSLRRAMVYGSVLGSFAVEKFGLERLLKLKRREIYRSRPPFPQAHHVQIVALAASSSALHLRTVRSHAILSAAARAVIYFPSLK